jgi:CHAD domain-containing protein
LFLVFATLGKGVEMHEGNPFFPFVPSFLVAKELWGVINELTLIMPEENFLLSHWQSEVDSLKKHLKKFSSERLEQVHKFRINIKKLRAYLRLYLLISKRKEDRQLFRETENLFSVFGEHRNMELNKSRAKKLFPESREISFAYLSWLEDVQSKLDVEVIIEQYDPSGLDELSGVMKENLKNKDGKELMNEISEINNKYLKKAKMHMHHFSKNFHQVRKELKTIFYLSKISFPLNGFSKAELERLEEILELLGRIQDIEVSRDLLYQFRETLKNEWGQHVVERCINSIILKKDEDMVKVQKKAEEFLNTVER